jgi:hypothetical protein
VDGEEARSAAETTLTAAGLKTDDASLLAFFRSRTLSPEQEAQLADRARELGAEEYQVRVKATADLIAAGRRSMPFVRPCLPSEDREVARRARWVMDALEKSSDTPVILAAANLLALRRPAQAAEVLLDYLPFAEESIIEHALFEALCVVGLNKGKPDPAVVRASRARNALQRGMAGALLGRSSLPDVRATAIPLLADPELSVRYRTAEGLLAGRDRRGLPVLVALLTAPNELAEQAESLLQYVAGDNTPDIALGTKPDDRRKCRDVWDAWWKEFGETLDLARLEVDRRQLGLRLVVVLNGYGGQGMVWEHGNDHRNRWEMTDVGGPFDARVLPGNRVLVGEYDGRRVSERDSAGKVLWEHRTKNGVLEVQRLPGGNTLVTTNWDVTEITKAGKEVFTHADPGGNIFTGQRLPNGNTLYGVYSGHLIEVDRLGKEVKRVEIERPTWGLINVEVLPNGHYLLPYSGSNRVVELDGAGKVVWKVDVPSPTCVASLPGGGLLVGSHRMNYVREIDRKGTVLWEKKTEGQVFRVRVR